MPNHSDKANNQRSVTEMIQAWEQGEESVEAELFRRIYPMLHQIARQQLRRSSGSVLQTTEVVSEAYLRLQSQNRISAVNRQHFYAIVACVMKRVLVDEYRFNASLKRGSFKQHVKLSDVFVDVSPGNSIDLLCLNQLLEKLKTLDPLAAQVVELRFFAGLTMHEIAEAFNLNPTAVKRNWAFARSWLLSQLKDVQTSAPSGETQS